MKSFLASFGVEFRNKFRANSLCPYAVEEGTKIVAVEGEEEDVRRAAKSAGATVQGQRLLSKKSGSSKIWYLSFPLK